MRVLLIADWTSNVGGTERLFEWLRDGLRSAGDDVRLLTSSAGDAAGGSADYVAFGSDRPAAQLGLQLVNPSAVRQARRARRAFAPDVAVSFMFEMHLSPAVLLALRGLPTVALVLYPKPICPTALKLMPDGSLCMHAQGLVCLRGGCTPLPQWLRDRPRYRMIQAALRQATTVLTCSEALRDELADLGLACETIDLGVPVPGARFERRPAQDPLFTFVGRLNPEKGVELLLRAFAKLAGEHPRARLRIVGDGPLRAQLEALAARLGVGGAVEFTGRVAGSAVEGTLADAWALVAPSLWPEPFGLVAIEALMRGVPVVASATGGFARTVEPGVTGLLFANGDEAALGECLDAIARGRAFSGHTPAPEGIVRVRERYGVDVFVDTIRERLEAAIAA